MLLGVTLVSFTIIGCGSSGDDTPEDGAPGGNPPVVGDKVVISEQNKDQVVASILSAADFGFEASNFYVPANPVAYNSALKAKAKFKTMAASETIQCEESGSYTSDYDSETRITTKVYDNCQEYGSIRNGTETDAWDDKDRTQTFTDYDVKSTYDDVEVYLKSATLKTTFDDEFYPLSMSLEADGYAKASGIQIDVENYRFDIKRDVSSVTMSMSGRVKTTPCLDKWVEVETVTAVKMNLLEFDDDDSCPIDGEIKVNGGDNTSMTINFNADKSADVSINGGSKEHYSSCDDLPDAEEVCQ